MRWSLGVVGVVVVAAAVAGLVSAGPVRAQGQSGDIFVNETKNPPASSLPSLAQFTSYGFSTGYMKVFGGTIGRQSQPEPILQGIFRYRFNDVWIGTGDFGFGWNSFKDQGDTVLTFKMGTIGAARKIARRLGCDIRVAGGLGVYRWNYKYSGQSLRDSDRILPNGEVIPGTERFYRGIAPGGYLGGEAEYRLTRHVTLLALLQQHYVFTADKTLFHSLFDENHGILSFRIGTSYHFSPYQGILWESKRTNKIRLESGKEGR